MSTPCWTVQHVCKPLCTTLCIAIQDQRAVLVPALAPVFEEAHFLKPFFLTWYNFALLTVYLPFYPRELCQLGVALRDSVCSRRGPLRAKYNLVGAAAPPRTASRQDSRESADDEPSVAHAGLGSTGSDPLAALSTALRLGFIFFAYQLCFNIGLELTAVSTATVISASAGLWTLLFSALRLREKVGPIKLLSTILTFGGVLLVALASGSGDAHLYGHRGHHHGEHGKGGGGGGALWGNGATLLSALLYGLYAAQLKHEVPDEKALPMPYLFGLIGLVVPLLLLPVLPVLHTLHLERFALPSRSTLLALTLNGLLGSVLSNMLLARAMVLASPLVATVGLSLSIPLAIAADALRGRGHFADAAPLLGTGAVWGGFLGVSAAEPLEKSCAKKQSCGCCAP